MQPSRRGATIAAAALVLLLLALGLWWSRDEGGDEAPATPAQPPSEAARDALPAFDAARGNGVDGLPFVGAPPRPLEPEPRAGSALMDAASTTASLLVRVRWETDRAPAPDIGLKLAQWDRMDPLFHLVAGRTDAQGEWRLEGLPPGRATVYTDRAGSGNGDLVAGQLATVELSLPDQSSVSGAVVDGAARAVPGALIWLSDYGNSDDGALIGRADDAGRYAVRGVGSGHYVGARAAGYTASPSVSIDDAPGEVTLVLGPRGGSVRGRVSEAAGQPVAGAVVLVGGERGWPRPARSQLPDNALNADGPPPMRATTDGDGAFLLEDVPSGPVQISARAEGWSPWSADVLVAAGETTEAPITLQPGAMISGTVRDESGQPQVGASLWSGQQGEYAWRGTVSDATGRYELRDVALGETRVMIDLSGVGKADATFEVEPGQSYSWDPVLTLGLIITGRVVDEQGAVASGYRVNAAPQTRQGADRRQARTDAEGRFTLANCVAGPHQLEVWLPVHDAPIPIATLDGIEPGSAAVEIVVPLDTRASASVSGLLRDASGAVVDRAELYLVHVASESGVTGKVARQTGAFLAGPVLPGRYELHALAEGFPALAVPAFDLGPDEQRDLGVIAFALPATLLVRVSVPSGVEPSSIQGALLAQGDRQGGRLERQDDGSLLSPPLHEGEYELWLAGPRAAAVRQPVRLRAGERTELEVALERCVQHVLQITMPLRAGPAPLVSVELLDAHGASVAQQQPKVSDHADEQQRRAAVGLCVVPGEYRLLIASDGITVVDVPLLLPDTGEAPSQSSYTLP